MQERALRRRCRQLLRELDIRPPLDVRELCRRLGAQRGRPIHLRPWPIEVPGPFGLWFKQDNADHIFYQQETSGHHQDHIILHELGHMIADHRSDEEDHEAWARLGDDIPPDAIRRALRRTGYNTKQEREAELIATIILEWANVPAGGPPPTLADPDVESVGNVLGHNQGW